MSEEEAEQKERLRQAETEAEETLERADELERKGEELDRTRPHEEE